MRVTLQSRYSDWLLNFSLFFIVVVGLCVALLLYWLLLFVLFASGLVFNHCSRLRYYYSKILVKDAPSPVTESYRTWRVMQVIRPWNVLYYVTIPMTATWCTSADALFLFLVLPADACSRQCHPKVKKYVLYRPVGHSMFVTVNICMVLLLFLFKCLAI